MDERSGAAPVTRHVRKDQWPRGGWNYYPPPRRSYPDQEYCREEMLAERLTKSRCKSRHGSVAAARCAVPEIFLLLYHWNLYSVSLTDQVWAGFSPDFTWQQGHRSVAKL
jgi:hypothetical protein